MATLTADQLKKIIEKTNKIDGMEASLQNLSDQYDKLLKDYNSLKTDYATLNKEYKALKGQVLQSSNDINAHGIAINDLEQYSRRDCLEIRGIPVTDDEETDEIVEKVGDLIDVNIDRNDISISHRLSDKAITRKDGTIFKRDPAIIVKFTKRSTREDFYHARKKLHKRTTRDIGYNRQREHPIFICESLTASNRQLFNKCLEFKKKHRYKFIWTHNGTTCLRKDSNSPVISIKTDNDIRRLQSS